MILDESGDFALLCGADNKACLVSISLGKPTYQYSVDDGIVMAVVSIGNRVALASSTGNVKAYDNGAVCVDVTQHAGKAIALAAHPSGQILASVGVDTSIILYDMVEGTVATQIFTNSSTYTVSSDSFTLTLF